MTKTEISILIEALITNVKYRTLPQPRLILRARHLAIVNSTELLAYDRIIHRLSPEDLAEGLTVPQWDSIIKTVFQTLKKGFQCQPSQTH